MYRHTVNALYAKKNFAVVITKLLTRNEVVNICM